MIDPQVLRRIAVGSPVVVVDHDGEPMARQGLSHELVVPGLLVSPVAEALKHVEAGRLIADLDRETMWVVAGFVLDITVLDALGDTSYSAEGLIQKVTSIGFDWEPTPL